MAPSTNSTVDVDVFLQGIGAWLTDASHHGERRLVICAVQRAHGIELVDGTPLELAIPRLADVKQRPVRSAARR